MVIIGVEKVYLYIKKGSVSSCVLAVCKSTWCVPTFWTLYICKLYKADWRNRGEEGAIVPSVKTP